MVPSLTTATSIWENLQHLVFDVWHFLESLNSKCHKKMIYDFLLNSFRHVVHQLSDASFNLVFHWHLFKLVTSRLKSLVHCLILVFLIRIVFLFFALNIKLTSIWLNLLTLIFSSCSLILMYSLLISQYSDMFFFNSWNIHCISEEGWKRNFPGSSWSIVITAVISLFATDWFFWLCSLSSFSISEPIVVFLLSISFFFFFFLS